MALVTKVTVRGKLSRPLSILGSKEERFGIEIFRRLDLDPFEMPDAG